MWTLTELATALQRGREQTARALQQTASPAGRARLLAEVLRGLLPSAPLYACVLRGDDEPHTCGLDETGNPDPRREEILRAPFNPSDLAATGWAVELAEEALTEGRSVLLA